MDLQLSSNVVDGICTIVGPQVAFVLSDTGQANVMINVALSDGTHVHFPNGAGTQASSSSVLPPGKYACTVLVAAFTHGAFGPTYASVVSIGGRRVATAQGTVAEEVEEEHDLQSFVLEVR